MKTIIISCNYFAKSENRLKNCLESLKMVKLPNTVILMGDNNSTDGSVELIQEYVDNGTIDVFYKSPKNIGKSKMLNTLYYIAKTKIGVEPNDVLMHLDSDIEIKAKDYLSIVEDYYSKALQDNKTICGIYPFVHSAEDQKIFYLFDILSVPEKDEYGFKVRTALNGGLAGGCFSTLCKYHETIGGYQFKQGINGIPIYGGDDGIYMFGLSQIPYCEFKIMSLLDICHPQELNQKYINYKRESIKHILSKQSFMTQGFFDKQISINDIYVPINKYNIKKPHVDIIILTKDHIDLIIPCIKSILQKSVYPDYRIIIGDTGSTKDNLNKLKSFIIDKPQIKLVSNLEYRFGRLNNQLVNMFNDQSENSLLLFCNNDIEFLNDCISEMVYAHENNKNIGTVGARLHYPDGKIQHAGIAVDSNGGLKHIDAHTLPNKFINNSKDIYKNPYEYVVGSTGALLMISRKRFNEVNGFNENYKVCFEDVELNMQMIKHGYKNIINYDSVAIHKENQTRGKMLDRNDINRYFNFFLTLKNKY